MGISEGLKTLSLSEMKEFSVSMPSYLPVIMSLEQFKNTFDPQRFDILINGDFKFYSLGEIFPYQVKSLKSFNDLPPLTRILFFKPL